MFVKKKYINKQYNKFEFFISTNKMAIPLYDLTIDSKESIEIFSAKMINNRIFSFFLAAAAPICNGINYFQLIINFSHGYGADHDFFQPKVFLTLYKQLLFA